VARAARVSGLRFLLVLREARKCIPPRCISSQLTAPPLLLLVFVSPLPVRMPCNRPTSTSSFTARSSTSSISELKSLPPVKQRGVAQRSPRAHSSLSASLIYFYEANGDASSLAPLAFLHGDTRRTLADIGTST
jgi:hypothetical protein